MGKAEGVIETRTGCTNWPLDRSGTGILVAYTIQPRLSVPGLAEDPVAWPGLPSGPATYAPSSSASASPIRTGCTGPHVLVQFSVDAGWAGGGGGP